MKPVLHRRPLPSAAMAALLVLGAGGAFAAEAPARTSPDDRWIYALIEDLRRRRENIVVDGNGDDWREFPAFPDARDDAGDAACDLVSTAIAPGAEDLLICVTRASAPEGEAPGLALQIDFSGDPGWDAEIELSPFDLSPPGGIEVAFGKVIEARIPYSCLGEIAEADGEGGGRPRPWIRVVPRATRDGRTLDWGASAASFRLIPTPYPLDPSPPEREANLAIRPPYNGRWFLKFGPLHRGHGDQGGYDFVVVDETFSERRPDCDRFARAPDTSLSWDQEILAPIAGTVHFEENAEAGDGPGGRSRFAVMPLPWNFSRQFCFPLFADGSEGKIPAREGETIGRVGRFGHPEGYPVLHLGLHSYEADEADEAGTGELLAFRNVIVGLNPAPDDPWARKFSWWDLREGFLVAALDPREEAARDALRSARGRDPAAPGRAYAALKRIEDRFAGAESAEVAARTAAEIADRALEEAHGRDYDSLDDRRRGLLEIVQQFPGSEAARRADLDAETLAAAAARERKEREAARALESARGIAATDPLRGIGALRAVAKKHGGTAGAEAADAEANRLEADPAVARGLEEARKSKAARDLICFARDFLKNDRPANARAYLERVLEMFLYASDGTTPLAYDDDGNGFFSRINRILGPGTYFIRVRSYNNGAPIFRYRLTAGMW